MTGLDAFTDVLDYPMYVVTAAVDGEQAGCLVGFASQCSIDPPRFMVPARPCQAVTPAVQ